MSRPNYAELIRDGARTLKSAGIDDPVRDARRLLRFVTGWTATELISAETEPATPAHAAGFAALLAERAARKPLAHLSGVVDFFGLTLRSDARALVPRSDSETVIDLALTHLPETQPLKLADLGTGSGALLAALLHARPNTEGTAIDASQDALDLAEENFTQLGFRQRVTLFRGSWTDWTGWADCALIVSNPPYIRSDIIPTLDPEVRAHDPRLALDGGPDGLNAYREIIALARQQLVNDAYLILEIGFDQRHSVSELLTNSGLSIVETRQDLAGNDRAIAAQKRC